jgi:hypothetical protein
MIIISSTGYAANCSQPQNGYGVDSLSISVPVSAKYNLWVRMQAASTTSNEIMLQADGTCFNVGGSSSISSNSWTWINYQNGNTSQVIQSNLNAGANNIELIGAQLGVSVDTVLALNDSNCIPSGTGTNCTTGQSNTAPNIGSPGESNVTTGSSSSAGATGLSNSYLPKTALSPSGDVLTPNNTQVQLSNPTTINPTYASGQTIKQVLYYLNNKLIYTANKAPFTYILNTNKLINGKYVLVSDTIYTSGHSLSASELINVKHPAIKNLYIIIINYIYLIIIILILVIGILWCVVKYRARISQIIYKMKAKHETKS